MQAIFTHFISSDRLRGFLAAWFAAAFGIFAFAGIMALSTSRGMAVFFAVGIAAGVAWLAWKRLDFSLDSKAISPAIGIVFLLSSILSLVQLTRLCVFIVNPAAVAYALGPHRGLGLSIRHLCMTAYFVAAQSATTVPNIYDEYKLYSLPAQDPDAPRKPRTIGPFDIDAYEYPPPFLLLPRTLAVVTPQFLNFRMLWFALYGAVVLIGLAAVAETFDPPTRTRVLLLSPLVLGAEITIGTLQVGNVQAAVIALAMLAMVLFTRGRHAAGGILLAFVIASKLFPGMLLVYLAARREWRAVVWTIGMGAALVCVSLIDMGSAPFGAFLHHMPRLLSGEAFPVFRRPGGVATNLSVPGLLFKLKLFGLPNGSFEAMKIVGTIYTIIVLAITAALGTRRPSKSQQPLIWLTVLILASLRSPFLPQYGLFPVLWLLILLAATATPSIRTLCLAFTAWLTLNIVFPVNGPDPRLVASMALVSQAIIVILIVLTLRQQQGSSVAMSPLVPDSWS